ncbi:MAG: chemotaxis-specific protein-glutamate methyltransferase CheB [Bacillota bacterium]
MIRVLVVDDSEFARKLIALMLESDPEIQVVDTAKDGYEALQKVVALGPDVVTMDLNMPVMDGIEALRRIMASKPVPVIVFAAEDERSDKALEALALGAVDFLAKSKGRLTQTARVELVAKVKAAASAKVKVQVPERALAVKATPRRTARVVVAIGASTGGPSAVERIVAALPGDLPAGLLITQHMPPGFTASFAKRLDRHSSLEVREAHGGEALLEGLALVAPGDSHIVISPEGRVTCDHSPAQYIPCIDVMMYSVAESFGPRTVGIVLTGMGNDGTRGMAAIRAAGGRTIVQDEATSVVFSMPRSVIESGHAEHVLPLDRIPSAVQELVNHILPK